MAASGQPDTREQHDELVVAAAAHEAGCSSTTIRCAIELGKIPARHVQRRGKEVVVITRADLADAIARHRCREPGCPNAALGVSGGCRDHDKAQRKEGSVVTCPGGCGTTRYLPRSLIDHTSGYCTNCVYESDFFRQIATENHARREEDRRRRLAELKVSTGKRDTCDVARELGLQPAGVYRLMSRGELLPAGRFDDNHRWLFEGPDVAATAHVVLRSTHPTFMRSRVASPESIAFNAKILMKRGPLARELREARARGDDVQPILKRIDQEAAARIAYRWTAARGRRGGNKPAGPKGHEIRWADRLPAVLDELVADYAQRQAAGLTWGDPPPSLWSACRALAYTDSDAHPDTWRRYARGAQGDLTAAAAELGAQRIYGAMRRKFPALLAGG